MAPKSIKINQQSIRINQNQSESIKINQNQSKSINQKSIRINQNQSQSRPSLQIQFAAQAAAPVGNQISIQL